MNIDNSVTVCFITLAAWFDFVIVMGIANACKNINFNTVTDEYESETSEGAEVAKTLNFGWGGGRGGGHNVFMDKLYQMNN